MADRPALVMLHGWGSSAAVWQPVIEQLSRDYDCYSPDLPGHAASELEQSDLPSLSRQILKGINRPAIWLAWSLGALMAIKAALLAPQQVQGLLIVSGSPKFVRSDDWPNAMPADVYDQFLDEYRANPARAQQRFIALQMHGDRHAREVHKELHASASPADSDILWGLEMLGLYDLHQEMAELSCPVHCLYGASDKLIPVAVGEDMQAFAKVTIWADTGHAPFLSDKQRFLSWMHGSLHG